jgi:phosphoribosyl-ATP pyrophosphohydrolase
MDRTTILAKLAAVVDDRNRKRPAGSYTTALLEGGVEALGAKVREEAAELIEAAGRADAGRRAAVIHEGADLVYHVLVLLSHAGVRLDDVEAELARRFGTSGLDEKASRPK